MPQSSLFGFSYVDPRQTVAVDADPNTTPPANDRIILTPLAIGATGGPCLKALVAVLDGTSATVSLWIRLKAKGTSRWVELLAAPLVVAADTVEIIENVPPSAEAFLQVTAAAGAPTILGVAFG